MKSLIVLVVLIVMGLSAMACDNAGASNNPAKVEAMKYRSISAFGYTAQKVNLYGDETAAALQQAMANNGFVNSEGSGVHYVADANWNEDKSFMTFCVRSQDRRVLSQSDRIMLGGCINVSSEETGVDGAIGVALLPKAAEKLSIMLKNQIEGKAMPNQTTEAPTAKPEKAPAANTANANTKK